MVNPVRNRLPQATVSLNNKNISNGVKKLRTKEKLKIMPSVTLIVAAHNEERVIKEKIENSLELDYPKDKLEIIVASDASTDRTNEIVRQYEKMENTIAHPRVILNARTERKGKSVALNDTVMRVAKGDMVIFTDATTFLKGEAIKKLLRNFSDERVGAVCGKIFYTNPNDSSISRAEGIYWKYDEFLKRKESEIGVLPFVGGPFYGLRKELYTPVQPHLPDDSVSPLNVYKKGYRVVFEEEAVAYERLANTVNGEFRIKSRGVVREMGAIFSFKELLNPFKHPLLSWVLFSHRLLRWSVGFLLVAISIANLFLLSSTFYHLTLGCQIIFYTLALIGFLLRKGAWAWRVFTLPFYFCLVNTAAMWGIIQYVLGKKKPVWEPVR
jgi:cellulose synthase/poly-beta-1,6-N-acetylglucosamine synthase-like glycosyltransferase